MGLISWLWPSKPSENGAREPQPSRGILDNLRHGSSGWPGPRLAPEVEAGQNLKTEQARSGPPNVIFPFFLPYIDDYTAEPAAARAAYRKMFADPNVKSALLGKILDVAALDLKIRAAKRKDKESEAQAAFVRWNLEERVSGCLPDVCWSILSGGLIDGYSVSEKIFGQEEKGEYRGQWPMTHLKPKDVGNDIIIETDPFRNIVSIKGLRYNAGMSFAPARFLIFKHLPLYGMPTGMSDLRAVYGRYWLLDTVLKLRGVNAEKRAMPHLIGTYQTISQKDSLERVLAAARGQTWSSVPEGVKIDALNIAGSADDVFAGFVRDLKHDIFLGIQGAILQALEGSVTEGRGNSQVHRSTADLIVWYLAATLQALFNDKEQGLIKDIVDLNYVTQDYPKASLSAIDVGELKEELAIDHELWSMGVDLSKEEIYDRYGRTPPESPEDALQGQGKQNQQGGGPPGKDQELPGIPSLPFFECFADPVDFMAFTQGFTGEIKDKQGHRRCYQDGRQVGCDKQEQEGGGGGSRQEKKPKVSREIAHVQEQVLEYLDAISGDRYPIHEFVSAYGKKAKQAIMHLAREGKVQLIPADQGEPVDPSDAANSIQGADGMLFYVQMTPRATAGKASQHGPGNIPKSKATISYESGSRTSEQNEREVRGLIHRMFSGRLQPEHLASVLGVPDDAVVELTIDRDGDGQTIYASIDHPALEHPALRSFTLDSEGEVHLHHDSFFLKKEYQGTDFTITMFAKAVANAQKAGLSSIATHAARGRSMNGYNTWPRFGYDQPIETLRAGYSNLKEEIKEKFPNAVSVLDIMQTKEGRDFWREKGTDLNEAVFDLTPGSRSMRVLEAYIQERSARGKPGAPPGQPSAPAPTTPTPAQVGGRGAVMRRIRKRL